MVKRANGAEDKKNKRENQQKQARLKTVCGE
jgi:hypothetical protein